MPRDEDVSAGISSCDSGSGKRAGGIGGGRDGIRF